MYFIPLPGRFVSPLPDGGHDDAPQVGQIVDNRLAASPSVGRRFTPIRNLLRNKVIVELVAQGHSADDVGQAFDALEAQKASSDHPIVDWFLAGGWKDILQAVLTIISLFANPPTPAPTPAAA